MSFFTKSIKFPIWQIITPICWEYRQKSVVFTYKMTNGHIKCHFCVERQKSVIFIHKMTNEKKIHIYCQKSVVFHRSVEKVSFLYIKRQTRKKYTFTVKKVSFFLEASKKCHFSVKKMSFLFALLSKKCHFSVKKVSFFVSRNPVTTGVCGFPLYILYMLYYTCMLCYSSLTKTETLQQTFSDRYKDEKIFIFSRFHISFNVWIT